MQSLQTFTLHIYDLPKWENISTPLISTISHIIGKTLEQAPDIDRNPAKQFFTAIVKIDCENEDEFNKICEKLRYFEMNGKECRALKADSQFSKDRNNQMAEHKICVQKIPAKMSQKELHAIFEQHGEIQSLQISWTKEHISKECGFITFKSVESAQKAVQRGHHHGESVLAVQFQDSEARKQLKYGIESKDEQEKQLLENGDNLFVKFIPEDWTESTLEGLFAQYGQIKSMKMIDDNGSKKAFVCFGDLYSGGKDKLRGFRDAAKAQEGLNGMQVGPNKLYVSFHKYRKDLVNDKMNQLRNQDTLFVKNYPNQFQQEDFAGLFGQYGNVVDITVNNWNSLIKFQDNNQALQAQRSLNGFFINGCQLSVEFQKPGYQKKNQHKREQDQSKFQQFYQNQHYQKNFHQQTPNQQNQHFQNQNFSQQPQPQYRQQQHQGNYGNGQHQQQQNYQNHQGNQQQQIQNEQQQQMQLQMQQTQLQMQQMKLQQDRMQFEMQKQQHISEQASQPQPQPKYQVKQPQYQEQAPMYRVKQKQPDFPVLEKDEPVFQGQIQSKKGKRKRKYTVVADPQDQE